MLHLATGCRGRASSAGGGRRPDDAAAGWSGGGDDGAASAMIGAVLGHALVSLAF